ncbi:recombination regulator RecX [Embleya sp. NPDC059237]|uniref:recombination regulator RecX n=1 Tax=Embleya sp. NPDC059237 TaxID=3346784 RepID=UPI003697DDD0
MVRPAGEWSNTWGDGSADGSVSPAARPPVDAAELRAAMAAIEAAAPSGADTGAGGAHGGGGGRRGAPGAGTRRTRAARRDPQEHEAGEQDPIDDGSGADVTGTDRHARGRGTGSGRAKRDRRAGTRGRARRDTEDSERPADEDVDAAPEPLADPEATARAICLRLLTGRARTRAQLADALRRREVPDEVAEYVLGRFTDVGLIDDTAFADAWVSTRHTGKGLARRALAQELRRRGVDAVVVDEAVAQLEPEQELETARALVARRLPGTRGLDRDKRIRRLAGMLARKGYGEGLAVRVVREALDHEAEADENDDPAETPWRAWDGPA